MNADAERTLTNLNVIAVVSQNDKLMTNEDQFDIYTPTSLRGLVRAWYGERRNQNMQRVRTTVRAAMTFASAYLDDAASLSGEAAHNEGVRIRMETCVLYHIRMCDALKRCTTGLTNMQQTYRDDAATASQLSNLAVEINDYLQVIQPYYRNVRERRSSPLPSLPPFSRNDSVAFVETP